MDSLFSLGNYNAIFGVKRLIQGGFDDITPILWDILLILSFVFFLTLFNIQMYRLKILIGYFPEQVSVCQKIGFSKCLPPLFHYLERGSQDPPIFPIMHPPPPHTSPEPKKG
jgi:hypothetical protein